MLVAILAAIGAVIVVVAVVIAVFVLYNRNHTPRAAHTSKRTKVLDTVGVEPTVAKRAGTDQRVSRDHTSNGGPAANLEPRFKVMGGFAGLVFAALGIKVATLQILNNETYTRAATENQMSTVYTPAPRGIIYDCKGRVLVGNRSSLTILAEPDVSDDRDVIARLSAVLGTPQNVVKQRIEDATTAAQDKRVVASDATLRQVSFISEHADAFPGVTVETRTVRSYPYDALGAHFLGYTGTVSEDELASVEEGRSVKMGDDVGKSGVEATYDNVLAGTHGERQVVTDANSNIVEIISETEPTKGDDVYLTIDASVQYLADSILAQLIAPSGAIGSGTGTAGAIVALDVRTGGVICMASYPTFSPKEFIGGIPSHVWEVYNSDIAYNPMLNRAIAGTYPAASTYKAFTGLASLIYGFTDLKGDHTFDCTGSWDGFGTGDVQNCWDLSGHGELDLRGGIVNSCDVVFYEIAKSFFENSDSIGETAMQDVIKRYNFGELSGIDLAGEAYGRVPTPEWKKEYFKDVPEEATWRGGDSTNMVIGQGYVLVTPLQIACGYMGVATGKIMRPHLLKEVRHSQNEASVQYQDEVVCEPEMEKEYLEYVRDALHGVATENYTVAIEFESYGIDAGAKTGTGEVAGKGDYALAACYAPYEDPKYVVVTVIEEGGGGSDVAMPVAAEIMDAIYRAETDEDVEEPSTIAGSTGKVIEGGGSSSSGRSD